MLFISKCNVAKQIVTVLLVNFGRRDNLEGVGVHNPPQSGLPRSLGFLVIVIVIGSALKKLFDLMMRGLNYLVIYPSQGLTRQLEVITEMVTNYVYL